MSILEFLALIVALIRLLSKSFLHRLSLELFELLGGRGCSQELSQLLIICMQRSPDGFLTFPLVKVKKEQLFDI